MKKINGTWLELHHHGLPEGKYFNDQTHNFTDEMWKEKIKEIAELGMEYIVLMQIAYTSKEGNIETFYDSELFPKSKMLKANDPLDDILSEAEKHNMKVFMSVGFYGHWLYVEDNMRNVSVISKSFAGMKEVYKKYGHYKSFYGWYLPDESEIHDRFDEFFIDYCNLYNEFIKALNPNHKVLIAPYGTCHLVADLKYIEQLKRLNVDIIAYQDEVGVKKTDEYHTATYYRNLKAAHDAAKKSALWADMEVFTFEGDVYKSALLPTPIDRIKRQMEAISPYIDELIIFEYQGMMNKPNSKAFAGHPDSSIMYQEYVNLLKEIDS